MKYWIYIVPCVLLVSTLIIQCRAEMSLRAFAEVQKKASIAEYDERETKMKARPADMSGHDQALQSSGLFFLPKVFEYSKTISPRGFSSSCLFRQLNHSPPTVF